MKSAYHNDVRLTVARLVSLVKLAIEMAVKSHGAEFVLEIASSDLRVAYFIQW